MEIEFNVLGRQYMMFADEYKQAAIRVLESGWYVLSKELENFEVNYAEYMGSKYCVGINSGLDALILAFRAIGIKRMMRSSFQLTLISLRLLVSQKTVQFLSLLSRMNIVTWVINR